MISSPPDWKSYKEAPIKGGLIKRFIKSRFRYVDYPFLLGYRGFGNAESLVVQGHVFKGMAMTKPRKKTRSWRNFITLIKMFLIRTVPRASVKLHLADLSFKTQCGEDGFFEFQIDQHNLPAGWYTAKLELCENLVEGQEEVSTEVDVLVLKEFEYGCISDIDDTFLVSHVTRFWRKIYLLVTKDPESRKPFEGVVDLYQQLCKGDENLRNPFFYVSSSEWNLYDFLIRFMDFHDLPKGVLQLKRIKDSLLDFFKSGYGSHEHKREKIERIFKSYPDQSFVLLGDNGQHDAYIYRSIAEQFPDQVKAVYIRAVKKSHSKAVDEVLEEIEAYEIPVLQFKDTHQAMEHARKNALIR